MQTLTGSQYPTWSNFFPSTWPVPFRKGKWQCSRYLVSHINSNMTQYRMRKVADKMTNPIIPDTKYNYFFIFINWKKWHETGEYALRLGTGHWHWKDNPMCSSQSKHPKGQLNPLLVTKKCLSVCNIFAYFRPHLSPGQNMVIQGYTLVIDDSCSVFFGYSWFQVG